MAENPPPYLPGSGQKLKPASRRQYRLSDEHSPTRNRPYDELLSQLTPMSAVDVLQHPTPDLKACLDASTANEKEFAMRTALASQKIYEWMDELQEWPWPNGGGSAGFLLPAAKRRRVSTDHQGEEEEQGGDEAGLGSGHLGSLPAEHVERYEDRMEDISDELEELEIDEIKAHIMHNHIMPLSRPGTPMSDSNRSVMSVYALNRLDDLSSVVTAIVLQALPNLSKLNRLLGTWTMRLLVLRSIPAMMSALSNAEVALQSGWSVISVPAKNPTADDGDSIGDCKDVDKPGGLTQNDYDVMKLVLQKKITKAAWIIDTMLDRLEGGHDSLPDKWIDRMDSVETGYGAWNAACESRIRNARLTKTTHAKDATATAPTPNLTDQEQQDDPGETSEAASDAAKPGAAVPITVEPPADEQQHAGITRSAQSSTNDPTSMRQDVLRTPVKPPRSAPDDATMEAQFLSPPATLKSRTDSLQTPISLHRDDIGNHNDADDMDPVKSDLPTPFADSLAQDLSTPTARARRSTVGREEDSTMGVSNSNADQADGVGNESVVMDKSDSDSPRTLEVSDDEPDLPPLIHNNRRSSGASYSSTVIHAQSSQATSSDMPEISASPPLPRHKFVPESQDHDPRTPVLGSMEESSNDTTPEMERRGGADSAEHGLPSSPPLTTSFREESGSPAVGPAREEDDSLLRTSFGPSSLIEDDADQRPSTIASARRQSDVVGDEHLQQQIHDILESIPANIKLSASPKVNLNPPPPDLPAQRMKKPAKDPIRRSTSALSSRVSSRASTRASTPSFLLAPAYGKNPRPQRQRGQQETKVYHLSRSTGEAPIKLLVRCVGENGERVMVRVGGGWADLGEYLKEYASHHGRRSNNPESAKIEVRDLPRVAGTVSARASTASPPARPASALESSPMTSLNVRKTRRSFGSSSVAGNTSVAGPSSARPFAAVPPPKTPAAQLDAKSHETPASDDSTRSRSSSRLSWTEEDSTLGLAGPTGRKVEMSDESRAWVESVKEKVRLASGERKPPVEEGRFGEIGKVGGTKRLFRKG